MTRVNLTLNNTLRYSMLSEDQKETIFNGMLKTLHDTGANVHHEEARELLKRHGCLVDGVRVRIPPHKVREALSTLPPTTTLFSWEGEEMCYVEKNRTYFGPGPTPPNFIDTETLERRPYLRKDASLVARVCDALPNIGYVQSLGSISDVTNGLADVYEFADMIQNTTKTIMNWSFNRANVRDLHRIGIAMAGGEEQFRKYPNFIYYGEPTSPLVSTFDAVDKLMYCAEHRIPQVYSPCSIGGATVPASYSGQLVVALAESMVGVVVAQLLNPGTCVIVGGVQSVLDMSRGIYSYGAPELSILSAALTEMCKYCGLPMYSTSGCTDTKAMDTQSGIEAALSIHAAALSGANFIHDNGYTESGITGDVFQTVLDDECIGMAFRIAGGIEINEETLAVDVIKNVGPGGNFLSEEHTYNWFRKEHWQPTLMDRNSHEQWKLSGETTMKERVIEKTRELIRDYEGPVARVPKDAQKEIARILEEAESRAGQLVS